MSGREPRLPIQLRVAYRTQGAFLVAYSVNLSKGGVFLETNTPLPVGEWVSLSLEVPSAGLLEVQGVVAWVRQGSPDGLPDGMGIQFRDLEEQYGDRIDGLVRTFVGLTVLVTAASPDRLALLARYVRSIIACDIIEATTAEVAEAAIVEGPDLAVIDLDVQPEMGLRVTQAAKAQGSVPVILLAGAPERREAGVRAGADEALATPPSFLDLQAAVIRTLSRPVAEPQQD